MKRSIATNIIIIILTFLSVYVAYQLYTLFNTTLKTQIAIEFEAFEEIEVTGVACRSEIPLEQDSQGVLAFTVSDATRVSADSVIAEVYSNEQNLISKNKIDQLDYEIQSLKIAKDANSIEGGDISVLERQQNAKYQELLQIISSKNYSSIENTLSEFRLALAKLEHSKGNSIDFESRINVLSGVRDTLSQNTKPFATITAPNSGYFVSSVDGYENELTIDSLKDYTSAELAQFMSSFNVKNNSAEFSKLITDYKWKFYCNLKPNELKRISIGMKLEILFSDATEIPVVAVVESISSEEPGELVMITLKCEEIFSDIVDLRVEAANLILKRYVGIRVPKSAIHLVSGQRGVYIKRGNILTFKKVQPLFENDSFLILPKTVTEENQVELYDEVVVSGRNLYDNRIL